MASAERTYVDPSALRSLYVHDSRSARFCAWRKRVGGCLPLTRFGRAELVNSLNQARTTCSQVSSSGSCSANAYNGDY